MNWVDWPGAAGGEWPESLHVERGIYGKANRVRTDFRWLACSEGMGTHRDLIRELIRAGPTDREADGVLWRCFEHGFLAVRVRKSLARDADRRPGLVERDVLWWKVERNVPVAVAAAVLLEHAQSLKSDWWPKRGDPRWQDEEFRLSLPKVEVLVDPDRVHGVWERGLKAFESVEAGSEEFATLTHACASAGSGAGSQPALIHWPGDSWGAAHISAFLLLFESSRDISIAGTVSSSRISADGLAGAFDVVVVPRDVAATPVTSFSTDAVELRRSRALVTGTPPELSRERVVVPPAQIPALPLNVGPRKEQAVGPAGMRAAVKNGPPKRHPISKLLKRVRAGKAHLGGREWIELLGLVPLLERLMVAFVAEPWEPHKLACSEMRVAGDSALPHPRPHDVTELVECMLGLIREEDEHRQERKFRFGSASRLSREAHELIGYFHAALVVLVPERAGGVFADWSDDAQRPWSPLEYLPLVTVDGQLHRYSMAVFDEEFAKARDELDPNRPAVDAWFANRASKAPTGRLGQEALRSVSRTAEDGSRSARRGITAYATAGQLVGVLDVRQEFPKQYATAVFRALKSLNDDDWNVVMQKGELFARLDVRAKMKRELGRVLGRAKLSAKEQAAIDLLADAVKLLGESR